MENQPNVEENGFPVRFKQFLEGFGLNTNSLANALGDSNPVKFRRWASGEVSPSTEALVQIALKYGVDVNWLLLGEGTMKRGKSEKAGLPAQPDIRDTIIHDQREQIRAIQKSHDQLQTALLHANYPDLFREKEGVKLESSSHTTAELFRPVVEGFRQQARRENVARMKRNGVTYYNFSLAKPMNPRFYERLGK